MEGWVKLHRELIDKPIWLNSKPEHKAILITILCLANHSEKSWEWQGKQFSLEPGQFITSLDSLKEKTGKGITIQNIRSCLKRLEKLQFLTNKSTKTGRLITIVNWGLYQSEETKPTKQSTKNQQRGNKEPTTNKNDKNVIMKEDIKDISSQDDDEQLKFDINHPAFKLTKVLTDKMIANNPKAKIPETIKQTNNWLVDMERIIRLDKYEPKQIQDVIVWCQADNFWSSNILSPKKLREKMGTLIIQMNSKGKVTYISKEERQKKERLSVYEEYLRKKGEIQ